MLRSRLVGTPFTTGHLLVAAPEGAFATVNPDHRQVVHGAARCLLFSDEERPLAVYTPAVASNRAILFDDAVTRHEDRDRVGADRLGDLADVACAELRRQGAVIRRLAHRDIAKHPPDLDLV